MPVKLAKKVGFCFGVKRAIDIAEDVIKKEVSAYSLGSLIHNRQVVEALSARGLKVIDDIDKVKSGCIVISSHGISPYKAEEIKRRSLKLVDTTCPFVRNAQDIAKRLSQAGYRVIIVGDANHPEVKALVDFAGKNVSVIKDVKGIKALRLKPKEKIGILSQTTQAMNNFLPVVRSVIDAKPGELRVFNTICRDAEDRQLAAQDLAQDVDLMLIVGGRNSANTKRLLEVCKKILKNSYLIETCKDLKDAWFKKAKTVGITSGASTPDWIVKDVASEVGAQLKNKKERKVANSK
ncbi:MAG: 4-hydroxy-3-methylbut-2-enyl diphosphate reductase [Candidatus Omnitrophota bacterium]|nr:4-hydroxy-3-methylbut-2-enyl diphosphate reductase [Candidatus Omnitrophota bacterium]